MAHLMKITSILLAALLAVGCGTRDDAAGSPASFELRAYDVPSDRAEELARALGEALASAESGVEQARVSRGAGGQLLVSAPPSIQRDVSEVLAAMLARESEVPHGVARLDVWIIEDGDPTLAPDPRLQALEPALAELRAHAGLERPVLVDRMSTVVALPDGEGMVQSAVGNQATFRLRAGASGLLASFELSHRMREPTAGVGPQYFASTDYLPVELGQWLVLHHFILPGGEGVSRSRSVVVQLAAVDSGP